MTDQKAEDGELQNIVKQNDGAHSQKTLISVLFNNFDSSPPLVISVIWYCMFLYSITLSHDDRLHVAHNTVYIWCNKNISTCNMGQKCTALHCINDMMLQRNWMILTFFTEWCNTTQHVVEIRMLQN